MFKIVFKVLQKTHNRLLVFIYVKPIKMAYLREWGGLSKPSLVIIDVSGRLLESLCHRCTWARL